MYEFRVIQRTNLLQGRRHREETDGLHELEGIFDLGQDAIRDGIPEDPELIRLADQVEIGPSDQVTIDPVVQEVIENPEWIERDISLTEHISANCVPAVEVVLRMSGEDDGDLHLQVHGELSVYSMAWTAA